jgi:hypothetical protein
MSQSDIWANIYLEMSVIYQIYYMASEICKIDETFNDFYRNWKIYKLYS